jgi:myo-inositol-1(or 4)-monophosphatase
MQTPAISIQDLLDHVRTAGAMALEEQRGIGFSDRAYKADDSVVTEADRRVEDFLYQRIATYDPEANIITEESPHPFDHQKPRTFAVDPIDGTDVFSQGMPGWCISVGLLDQDLVPVAGVVFAPRLDLLLVAELGKPVTLNGSQLPPPAPSEPISARSNLMVTSRIHKHLDLSGYIGKIRGIGSAALHLCYPLIYPAVIGALEGPGAHIWDIAAAHAITRAQGRDLVYLNGEPLDYATMTHGQTGRDVIVAGAEPIVETLRDMLRRLR